MVPAPRRHSPLLLELDLTASPVEIEPADPIGRFRTRHRVRMQAVLRTLHEAGPDKRVAGLLVKLGGAPLPWATMQELRAGVLAFAASGKPTVAWAESLGEQGTGSSGYVLASAFGQIWLQPSGEVGLLGVAAETTFLRGALDKLGIEPQLGQRYEYKSAADRVMRSEFTPEHREAVDRLVETTWNGAVDAIADARGLAPQRVREIADSAPLTAADALSLGLVDHLGYRDEVYTAVRAAIGEHAELLFADRWSPRRRPTAVLRRHRPVVAMVEANGEIVSGRSRRGARAGQLGSDTVCAALRAARQDDGVAAVLFRIDSPGGSAVASDTIWREVLLTRQAGKPVVVSMGALAGSGGYYIACPADVIVAQPATLTGSIGVIGGKVVVAELLDRVGLGTGAVHRGAHALMSSVRQRYGDGEQAQLDAMLDSVYAQFVDRVSTGRSMSTEAVEAVARGRVWTGVDAAANGLVDVLGGRRDAARIARERAGLPADAPLRAAVHVPPLARLGRARSSEDPRAASLRASTSAWGDLAGLAATLGLPAAGPLLMPAVRLI